jgi:hypothetical protein
MNGDSGPNHKTQSIKQVGSHFVYLIPSLSFRVDFFTLPERIAAILRQHRVYSRIVIISPGLTSPNSSAMLFASGNIGSFCLSRRYCSVFIFRLARLRRLSR